MWGACAISRSFYMIKISSDSFSAPAVYAKEIIVIGDGPDEAVDIPFGAEGMHKNHIKIQLKDNEYWVFNQANDPFVTLNGQPFWKKKLAEGDILKVRNHILKIEQIAQELDTLKIEPTPIVNEAAAVSQHIEEAYNLEQHKQPRKTPAPPRKSTPGTRSKKIVNALLLFSFCVLASLAVLSLEIYFRTATKIDREEMLAAESIADYAMALQYAKVYHIAPQKQNWIDPQFLKNNLVDLLSTTSLPCGNIDAQGQFSNCPYILRFYTNRDFSRFLLIAQPDATFSEWIIAKKTLILDSSLMELRKTDDLKTLNRLLSYPTPLDGSNGEEIKRALMLTEVIPLATLSSETGKPEFSPPNALKFIKPGAENLIYNAPRYHLFGETFLKKAIALSEDKSPVHERNILQSELDTLAKFHDLVFYSSKGINEAFKGHQALQKLVIPANYFTAYLLFSKDGIVNNSRLIFDNDLALPEETLEEKNIAEKDVESFQEPVVETDEIFLANVLRKKIEVAQEDIGPVIQTIYTILEDTIERDSLYLPRSAIQLFDLYQTMQVAISSSLKKMIDEFKTDHPQIAESTIEHLLREYGLLDFYLAASPKQIDLGLDQWNAFQEVVDVGTKKKFPPMIVR